ncbi:MAG: shikimate dehydrogenase [Herbiconiux sp.]|nr:shikimate dehydrogenase [Herbiconiux sp.]
MATFLEASTDRLHVPHRFGVLGSPIAHSKSPLLHRTAYQALGLPWEYDAYEVDSDALAGFVGGLDSPWRGLSLTMPLKETVLPLLDEVDAIGRATGAVNTVLITVAEGSRRLTGFNTDVYGIRAALEDAGITASGHALVIGAGATARSAVAAVAQLGAEHVTIALRSPDRAAEVVETARASGLSSTVVALDDDALAVIEPDLTVSTLPGGAGVGVRFSGSVASSSSPLLDVAYHPWPSDLASVWEEAGSRAVPGVAMLVHQAVAQIRVFVHGDPLLPLTDEPRITAALLAAVDL